MAPSSKYVYFIGLEKSSYSFNLGRIFYIEESVYVNCVESTETLRELPVIALGRINPYKVKVDELRQLTETEAGFLQAEEEGLERLQCFLNRDKLDYALSLTKNSPVMVEIHGMWCEGVIRYIGGIHQLKNSDPITGTFFGIELKGKYKGKGLNRGSYRDKVYFNCDHNCGIFAPFTRVRPVSQPPGDSPPPLQRSGEAPMEPLTPGDRVTFFTDNHSRSGMVMGLERTEKETLVHISMDTMENGESGEMKVPVECVIKEELLSPAGALLAHSWGDSSLGAFSSETAATSSRENSAAARFSLNSMVQVKLKEDDTVYGTVRWIGKLPEMNETMVGLELDEDKGVGNGSFKGIHYFSCPSKRCLFVKMSTCQPDSRFQSLQPEAPLTLSGRPTARVGTPVLGKVAPLRSEQVPLVLLGDMKGIQGHCNSCYMDSALFSLFSCSSVLDSLLFKSTDRRDAPIQDTLLHEIVNPLRSNGFVPNQSVMKLRKQLQEGGHCSTYTTDEKDPEEFLSLIMSQILCLEPLLKLVTGKKVQESYCYQIFLDQNHSLVLPTVQQLLEHSFHSTSLRLDEVPSCLILQMPRFGKKFKLFEKIIPTLELDISDLLSESPQECVLCGKLASEECGDCFGDPTFGNTGYKQFCSTCSKQVHTHPSRQSHRPHSLRLPEGFHSSCPPYKEKLQLFAVLCIETSHYVSFVKYGTRREDWIFFDSMADRHGDESGYNIPRVQACPEVARYLDMPLKELAAQTPREMDGVAKRLFCDAYMYLYQSPSMALYH